ncbi:thiamine phosphate synthase [Litchfieldia salsa]|uniref:Thiazole tautomerase (Transcriptional regulator TenI) n=1 Tax=Litchfieldia salsa TaxID=930152 RepID=A0A1H0UY91_9BACI|nr:thiamine phosphate synthase [Litchfieldia salsa]SDP71081.1 thiazole tautomerase (transcriptional regulator TenI) [Litchfieldia salsa]
MKQKELHIISTGNQTPQAFCEIARLIQNDVSYFHIREKSFTAKEFYDTVMLLVEGGISLSKIILNDRVDVACVTGVSGVQLAYHSLKASLVKKSFPNLRIGSSVHSVEELTSAQNEGADYVFFGHIYPTTSKPGLPGRGVKELRIITEVSKVPVIAIGGINPSHVKEIIDAGASGIALMSGVLEANNPVKMVKEYASKL